MLTIALDEGGKFEFDSNQSGKDAVSFIGGVLFQCEKKENYENELNRLQSFFERACRQQGAIYPQDLHPLRDNNGTILNRDKMGRVKTALAKEMSAFLTGTGSWEFRKPAGEYYLYALASDRQGRKELTVKGLSNLLDDNVGSNRYEHMAYRAVENLLFYNPLVEDDDMKLQLATRSLPVNSREINRDDYDTLGYFANKGNRAFYHITDASGYRAALATAIQTSSRKNIQFDMSVVSINYEDNSDHRAQGFLYLADTVCSIFQDATDKVSTVGDALQNLLRTGNRILGPGRTFLYAYSSIDAKYRKAANSVNNGNYFDALRIMSQSETGNVAGASVYRQLWFNALEKRMTDNGKPQELQTALEKLDNWLETPEYSIDTAKYIHDRLTGIAERLPQDRLEAPLLFRFYCTAIRISNHRGDYNAALAAYEKCLPMAQYVTMEDYLELRNLYTVALQDSGKDTEALAFVTDTVAYEERLVVMKKEIIPSNNRVFVHYGRTLSQMAQALSFAGRYDEAAEAFEKAMAAFGSELKEREFTLSLYLHALIEKGDRVAYEKYAAEYFGSEDRNKQLDYICGSPKNRSPRFMLYVYCKAEVLLYGDQLRGRNVQGIIERIGKKYQAQKDGHPWEMVFKYCAFMNLIANNGRSIAQSENLMVKARESVADSKDGVLTQIVKENDRQFAELCKGKKLKDIYATSPLNYMYR